MKRNRSAKRLRLLYFPEFCQILPEFETLDAACVQQPSGLHPLTSFTPQASTLTEIPHPFIIAGILVHLGFRYGFC